MQDSDATVTTTPRMHPRFRSVLRPSPRLCSSRRLLSASSTRSAHEVLGLAPGATEKDVQEAYLSLAKRWHPDRPEGCATRFREILHARETLAHRSKMHDAAPKWSYQQHHQEASDSYDYHQHQHQQRHHAKPEQDEEWWFTSEEELRAKHEESRRKRGRRPNPSEEADDNRLLRLGMQFLVGFLAFRVAVIMVFKNVPTRPELLERERLRAIK